ncbi:class I SAM-dependent methyltransferase [Candidatus Micrarchaeota archaeon]|nr:class I SAM-dependent methyltransferase [Candidatus Micrarchaeota archaeon]MBU1940113.1 class I SAM-dependent methyltransferase [Candidatus Micrarchaeota archaeon]
MPNEKKAVPAHAYSREYFGTVCDGFNEFEKHAGGKMPERLEKAFALVKVERGDAVLDVGCGRGELVVRAALAGAKARGIDYSDEALKFARSAIKKHGLQDKAKVMRADAKKLPFDDGEFTKIFFTDVIEHMHDWELREFMREARRVLRTGGEIVIETSPNALLAKPLYFIGGLVGINRGPVNQVVHVNEQTWFSIRRLLKEHGFKGKVWMEFDAGWFGAAVGGKRGAGLLMPIIKIMGNRGVKFIVEKSGAGIFVAPRIWCKAVKTEGD